jgi:4-hydroxybenzoate polyprenyltransferase
MPSSVTGRIPVEPAGPRRHRPRCLRRGPAVPPRLLACLRELRPHQWIKNVLIFLPLAAVQGLFDRVRWELCLAAFVAFCLTASSIYVFNDLMDLTEDRNDPQKLGRPLATGQLSVRACWLLQLPLLLMAGVIAWRLPHRFAAALAAYYLLMCAYSLVLKQVAVADILTLAAGYSLRVVAGAAVLQIRPSAWLIAWCGSLFTSLALLKRYSELKVRERAAKDGALRGYVAADAPILAMQGIASGYIAVLVLALYTTTDLIRKAYGRQQLFWLLCALLVYWINYLWLMARRGRVPHDPVHFAFGDRTSALLIAAMAVTAVAAEWLR